MVGRASMSANLCTICRNEPKIALCGICESALCKKCERYLEVDYFSFKEKVPEDLTQGHYCNGCFVEKIEPEMAAYNVIMEKAKTTYIFFDTSPLPRSLIKKYNKSIAIQNCKDRDETFMRLGFRSAEKGFNAVVEVVVERTRHKRVWEGRGIPAHINPEKQKRYEI